MEVCYRSGRTRRAYEHRNYPHVPGVERGATQIWIPWELEEVLELPESIRAYHGPVQHHVPLKSWQARGVRRILEDRRAILRWPVGSGKTLATVTAMATALPCRALVVAPRMVLNQKIWQKTLDTGWPNHPRVLVIETRKDAQNIASALSGPVIVLCSWELLAAIPPPISWDFIVADELHLAMSTYRCRRAKALRHVSALWPKAYVVGLTGTIVNSAPQNVFGQLDAIWPGRYGDWWAFARRYLRVVETQYTKWHIAGLFEPNLKELRYRLSRTLCTLAQEEEAELTARLKVFVHAKPIKPRAGFSLQSLLDKIDAGDEKAIVTTLGEKLEAVRSLLKTSTTQHQVIFTHFRSSAKALLESFPNAVHLDGGISPKARSKALDEWRKSGGLLIATMHSVQTGIDLSAADVVTFVEVTGVQGDIEQAIGRFAGLRSEKSVAIHLVCLERTAEERHAAILAKRIAVSSELSVATEVSNETQRAIASAQEDKNA